MRSMYRRNVYFMRYINKHRCDVRIYKDNLSEDEAWDIEKSRIAELKSKGEATTNIHVGGSRWRYIWEHDKRRIECGKAEDWRNYKRTLAR